MYVAPMQSIPLQVRCYQLPVDALGIQPESQLDVLDGLVSVTQQEWATSRQCVNGFSIDAA
jgi:hypothetical protein